MKFEVKLLRLGQKRT